MTNETKISELKAVQTGTRGYGNICGRITWKAGPSPEPITEEIACRLQREDGFHSGGYGLFNLVQTREESFLDDEVKHYATWECSQSCD